QHPCWHQHGNFFAVTDDCLMYTVSADSHECDATPLASADVTNATMYPGFPERNRRLCPYALIRAAGLPGAVTFSLFGIAKVRTICPIQVLRIRQKQLSIFNRFAILRGSLPFQLNR